MPRRVRLTLLAIGIFAFLAVSALLARALTGTGAEREAVLDVVRAQAGGDTAAVLAALPDCRSEPACVATTRARAARLRRPGEVRLLTYRASVGVSLTRQSGVGRVAWRTVADGRPVVQCVRVRREGPLTGAGVRLLSLSDPIGGEASCPR